MSNILRLTRKDTESRRHSNAPNNDFSYLPDADDSEPQSLFQESEHLPLENIFQRFLPLVLEILKTEKMHDISQPPLAHDEDSSSSTPSDCEECLCNSSWGLTQLKEFLSLLHYLPASCVSLQQPRRVEQQMCNSSTSSGCCCCTDRVGVSPQHISTNSQNLHTSGTTSGSFFGDNFAVTRLLDVINSNSAVRSLAFLAKVQEKDNSNPELRFLLLLASLYYSAQKAAAALYESYTQSCGVQSRMASRKHSRHQQCALDSSPRSPQNSSKQQSCYDEACNYSKTFAQLDNCNRDGSISRLSLASSPKFHPLNVEPCSHYTPSSKPLYPNESQYHFDAQLRNHKDESGPAFRRIKDGLSYDGLHGRSRRSGTEYSCSYPGVSWNTRMQSWLVYFEDAQGRKSRTFNPKRLTHEQLSMLPLDIRSKFPTHAVEVAMHCACIFAARVRWERRLRKSLGCHSRLLPGATRYDIANREGCSQIQRYCVSRHVHSSPLSSSASSPISSCSRSFPLGSPKPKKRCGASQLLCTMPGCDTVHGLPLSLVPSDNSKNEERVNIETETPLCDASLSSTVGSADACNSIHNIETFPSTFLPEYRRAERESAQATECVRCVEFNEAKKEEDTSIEEFVLMKLCHEFQKAALDARIPEALSTVFNKQMLLLLDDSRRRSRSQGRCSNVQHNDTSPVRAPSSPQYVVSNSDGCIERERCGGNKQHQVLSTFADADIGAVVFSPTYKSLQDNVRLSNETYKCTTQRSEVQWMASIERDDENVKSHTVIKGPTGFENDALNTPRAQYVCGSDAALHKEDTSDNVALCDSNASALQEGGDKISNPLGRVCNDDNNTHLPAKKRNQPLTPTAASYPAKRPTLVPSSVTETVSA